MTTTAPTQPSVQPREGQVDARYRASAATWKIAALFCLVICGALILFHILSKADDPLKSTQLKEYKDKLVAAPQDEPLKQRIRELDLQLRHQYFRQLSLANSGAWLLLGGTVIFLLAAKQAADLRKPLPLPQPKPNAAEQAARAAARARWSVAALGVAVAAGFLSLALGIGTALPSRPADLEKLLGGSAAAGAGASDFASLEDMQKNWPRFRGPDGNGVSIHTNTPITWDVTTGAGLAWKTEVPAPGFNSPVVWGDRVFLSGGDVAKRHVFCFDVKTGALLWRQPVENVPGSPAQLPEIPEQTGFAAPTMATDGRRAYVIFANGDLAAFAFDGKLSWAKNLGLPKNAYGHAASLAVWQDRLLVQFDQGESEEHKSKLYAFDGATGQIVWQRQRPVPSSWATPVVIQAAGKPQIITLGVPWVIAYAAADGTELWRADCLNGEVTPSPVFAGGMLLAVSPSDKLIALRPDGQGNVTQTHLAWTAEDYIPDISSPVSNGDLVFIINSGGFLTCYNVKDGAKQYEHDFDMECHASPSLVGDRLYLFGTKGAAIVLQAGRQFQELARTEMGESIYASPAFVQNRIFIRGSKTLFCIGAKEEKLAKQP
ncbi:MAG: PQQ-binding-like beta-propeller repeat protein [Verrucomicrobiota bacterium]